MEQVSNFILTLVVPGKAKELELLGQGELMASFHAVIRSYSKKRFKTLMADPLFHLVFSIFINEGQAEQYMMLNYTDEDD